jgi:hypothetical protein
LIVTIHFTTGSLVFAPVLSVDEFFIRDKLRIDDLLVLSESTDPARYRSVGLSMLRYIEECAVAFGCNGLSCTTDERYWLAATT